MGCVCSFREVMERQESSMGGVHDGDVGLPYDNSSGSGAGIFTWDVCTEVLVGASGIGYGTKRFSGGDR